MNRIYFWYERIDFNSERDAIKYLKSHLHLNVYKITHTS